MNDSSNIEADKTTQTLINPELFNPQSLLEKDEVYPDGVLKTIIQMQSSAERVRYLKENGFGGNKNHIAENLGNMIGFNEPQFQQELTQSLTQALEVWRNDLTQPPIGLLSRTGKYHIRPLNYGQINYIIGIYNEGEMTSVGAPAAFCVIRRKDVSEIQGKTPNEIISPFRGVSHKEEKQEEPFPDTEGKEVRPDLTQKATQRDYESLVKLHRIVDELEQKGVVKKHWRRVIQPEVSLTNATGAVIGMINPPAGYDGVRNKAVSEVNINLVPHVLKKYGKQDLACFNLNPGSAEESFFLQSLIDRFTTYQEYQTAHTNHSIASENLVVLKRFYKEENDIEKKKAIKSKIDALKLILPGLKATIKKHKDSNREYGPVSDWLEFGYMAAVIYEWLFTGKLPQRFSPNAGDGVLVEEDLEYTAHAPPVSDVIEDISPYGESYKEMEKFIAPVRLITLRDGAIGRNEDTDFTMEDIINYFEQYTSSGLLSHHPNEKNPFRLYAQYVEFITGCLLKELLTDESQINSFMEKLRKDQSPSTIWESSNQIAVT